MKIELSDVLEIINDVSRMTDNIGEFGDGYEKAITLVLSEIEKYTEDRAREDLELRVDCSEE